MIRKRCLVRFAAAVFLGVLLLGPSATVSAQATGSISGEVLDAASLRALADAAATAVGNRVGSRSEVEEAIEFGKQIHGIRGLVVIAGDRIGLWGDIELVPLQRKKG